MSKSLYLCAPPPFEENVVIFKKVVRMGLKKSVKKLYFVDSSYDKRGHPGLEMPISHII